MYKAILISKDIWINKRYCIFFYYAVAVLVVEAKENNFLNEFRNKDKKKDI